MKQHITIKINNKAINEKKIIKYVLLLLLLLILIPN